MDNRYRNQNNRGGQQDQSGGSYNRQSNHDRYGGGNRDNDRPSFGGQDNNRRYASDRDQSNFGDRYSQESQYSPMNDYGQQSQSYGRSQYDDTSHSYFRGDDYGGANMAGQGSGGGGYGGGSGDYGRGGYSGAGGFASGMSGGGGMGRDDYYGGSNYGSGMRDRSSGGQRGGYGGNNRQDGDRGFFDRMGDKIGSWFGDDDNDRSYGDRSYGESHRGRGPGNYKRSDERLLEDACEHLTHDHNVDASDIEVTVKDGEVTLDGTVRNRMAKRRAEDCVHDLSGVKHVQNNLRIKEDSDRYSSGSSSSYGSMSGQDSNTRSSGSGTIGDISESSSVKRDSDATNKATGSSRS